MARFVRAGLSGLCLLGLLAQLGYALSSYRAEALMTDAGRASNRSDPEAALDLYLRAEAWSPGDPKLHYLQGLHWSKLGKIPEAKTAYVQSLRYGPDIPITLIKYAELLAQSGEAQAAEEVIGRALKIAPADSMAQEIAGLVRGVQGDFAGAAKRFEWAVKLSPNPSPKLLNHFAYSLYKAGDHERALRYVDKALLKDALHPGNHLLRGKILLFMNRPNEAATALAVAEREYLDRLTMSSADTGKLKETRRYLSAAHKLRDELVILDGC